MKENLRLKYVDTPTFLERDVDKTEGTLSLSLIVIDVGGTFHRRKTLRVRLRSIIVI